MSTASRSTKVALGGAAAMPVLYLAVAYGVLPALWRHYEHNPGLRNAPKRTLTGAGIPGDPLNVGLVGTRDELMLALFAAGWYAADRATLRSGVGIVESVLLHRADPTAPVSNLFLWGRRQDLAFEKPVGGSARQRHHVRFWSTAPHDSTARTLWLGAATFDRGVGVSHYTGAITHHIAADIDAERDTLMTELAGAGRLLRTYQVTGIGPTLRGYNGGGDWFYTDGELTVGVLAPGTMPRRVEPEQLRSPRRVVLKNRAWQLLRALLP